NTVGDQVPHRVTPADSLTAFRGGDRQGGHFERAYASLRQSANVQGMSWARYRHKMCQFPEFSHVLPLHDLRHGIRARDEEQLSIGTLSPQVAQRVDRVGGTVAVDVDPADGESRVGCG